MIEFLEVLMMKGDHSLGNKNLFIAFEFGFIGDRPNEL